MQDPVESADDDMEDREFWMAASAFSMARIWGNTEDDVYAELLNDPKLGGEQSVETQAAKDTDNSRKCD